MSDVVDRLHALLFVADSPATLGQLAQALQLTEGQVEQALEIFERRLDEGGPLHLVKLADGYQIATRPEHHLLIAEFLKPQKTKMTRALLEILAIVAYKQPITTAEIDAVRGVQSEHGLRSLVERRLIQEVGRKQAVGRPILFGTTSQFLHSFNLENLSALPDLEDDPMFSKNPNPEN